MGWRNVQFNDDATKVFNENINIGYLLEINVQYPEEMHKLHNDLPFLPKRIKVGMVEKLLTDLCNK